MLQPDIEYLRRIGGHRTHPAALLHEPAFLEAQTLFFSTVASLGGTVDFDVADMREVHAVAALGTAVTDMRILDVGCGSSEAYVLEDTFRDRYPPFFAEMLVRRGARVTGVDIRSNPGAGYEHRVVDCTETDWTVSLGPPYDVIACLSLLNAPGSPFEHDAALCDRLMGDMHSLLRPRGLLIVTLRDELFDAASSDDHREREVRSYAALRKFDLMHCDGNCAWLRHRVARL